RRRSRNLVAIGIGLQIGGQVEQESVLFDADGHSTGLGEGRSGPGVGLGLDEGRGRSARMSSSIASANEVPNRRRRWAGRTVSSMLFAASVLRLISAPPMTVSPRHAMSGISRLSARGRANWVSVVSAL